MKESTVNNIFIVAAAFGGLFIGKYVWDKPQEIIMENPVESRLEITTGARQALRQAIEHQIEMSRQIEASNGKSAQLIFQAKNCPDKKGRFDVKCVWD